MDKQNTSAAAEEENETVETEAPTVEELNAKIAKYEELFAKLNTNPEESEEVPDVEEESTTESVKYKPTSIEIDYANNLKKKLGKNYDPEWDKTPFKQRISIMKGVASALKNVKSKKSFVKEAGKPKTAPIERKTVNNSHGINYARIGGNIRKK